ncbi:hypothetical protein OUZ56_028049 [Daphnia magna]|uniref:RNA polymerase II elongation factor ELL N-terminal domain-containing protein n=1 Tax=Daphnia magna TaxID=35525 RepID=A0ABR0B2P9_9CRUS|nr:hypothetical protein OUZ56_028049 [Daphnia magna]
MAVLADGVQYGLSAHGLSSENKSLVFVKLTDSSFKAIEEYLRIKLKTAQHPTVQFLGNEGRAPSFIVSCPFGSFWSTEGLGNMSDGQGRMNFGVVNIHSARVHWPLLPSLTLLTHHPLEQDKKKKQQKKTMSCHLSIDNNT